MQALRFLTFIAGKKIRQNDARQALQAFQRLLRDDAIFWLAVTLYGLAAGIVSYAASQSYLDDLDGLALVMNFPTFLVLMSFGDISMPEYIYPLAIIGISTAVWSFAGFIIYLFVWMFRLGP